MTALVKPCVVTAAVRAGYTLIAVPATVPCPDCDGHPVNLRCRKCRASASLPLGMTCDDHRPERWCPSCDGAGEVPFTVPCPLCDGSGADPNPFYLSTCGSCAGDAEQLFSPSPGDLLDIRAGDTLPDDGTRYGEWRVDDHREGGGRVWMTTGDAGSLLLLSPGEVLTVRVTEGPWPIIDWPDDPAERERMGVAGSAWIDHAGVPYLMGVSGSLITNVSDHAAFDPSGWTPGAQVIRVEVMS